MRAIPARSRSERMTEREPWTRSRRLRSDAVARQAPVGLDLGLSGAARADAATEALEMAPETAHAGEVVFELGELDLQLALRACGVRGKDVENHRGAIHDRQSQRRFEVTLLARGELVVAGDQVGLAALGKRLCLLHLAWAQIGVGVSSRTPLVQSADAYHAGRQQQLRELVEILLLVGSSSNAERPITWTLRALIAHSDAV